MKYQVPVLSFSAYYYVTKELGSHVFIDAFYTQLSDHAQI